MARKLGPVAAQEYEERIKRAARYGDTAQQLELLRIIAELLVCLLEVNE